MSATTKLLFSRWSDPRHPLYLAILFQVAIFVSVYSDHPFSATAFAGGTIGCAVAALRLQRQHRPATQ